MSLFESINSETISALLKAAHRSLFTCLLARIEMLKQYDQSHDECPSFSDELNGKGWVSFDHILADNIPAGINNPVIITQESKINISLMLIKIAETINECGNVKISESDTTGGQIYKLMDLVVKKNQELLSSELMSRDLEMPEMIKKVLRKLVKKQEYIDPGADEIVNAFVRFIKIIAYQIGGIAYDNDKKTRITSNMIYSAIRNCAILIPTQENMINAIIRTLKVDEFLWLAAKSSKKNKKDNIEKTPAPSQDGYEKNLDELKGEHEGERESKRESERESERESDHNDINVLCDETVLDYEDY